jgi:hypothetical protein
MKDYFEINEIIEVFIKRDKFKLLQELEKKPEYKF